AFLSGEFGPAQPLQDIGDIDLVYRNDPQDEVLEQSLADGGEAIGDAHCVLRATLYKQGSGEIEGRQLAGRPLSPQPIMSRSQNGSGRFCSSEGSESSRSSRRSVMAAVRTSIVLACAAVAA